MVCVFCLCRMSVADGIMAEEISQISVPDPAERAEEDEAALSSMETLTTGDDVERGATMACPGSAQSSIRSGDDAEAVARPPSGTEESNGTPTPSPGMFKTPMFVPPTRMAITKKTGSVASAFSDKEAPEPVVQTTEEPKDVQKDKQSKDEKSKDEKSKDEKNYRQSIQAEPPKSQNVPIPYLEPAWGGLCAKDYSFEVIKNGTVVDKLDLRTKSFYVFGRLPSCDVTMEHPSLSR